VGALIFDDSKILIVERAGEPLKGYWSLPGGLVEVGEHVEDALRREVLEETGLEIKLLYRFDLFERIMHDAEGRPEYHYVLVDYVAEVCGGAPRAGDDVSRLAWVERAELADHRMTEGTSEVIERAFRERQQNK